MKIDTVRLTETTVLIHPAGFPVTPLDAGLTAQTTASVAAAEGCPPAAVLSAGTRRAP